MILLFYDLLQTCLKNISVLKFNDIYLFNYWQKTSVLEQLQSVLGKNKLDFVLCVAGGWTGGNVSSKSKFLNSRNILIFIFLLKLNILSMVDFAKNCELMWKQSVITSIVAVSISVQFLKCGGLLVLSGASAALEPTPGKMK